MSQPQPQPQPQPFLYKILLIGDAGIGKSSILGRFAEEKYTGTYISTIGVDFKVKDFQIDTSTKVKLQLWDTAGQEKFKTLTNSYYRGAHGIVIVYDVTDRESFEHVIGWLDEVDIYSDINIQKIIVGNKIDLMDKKVVTTEEAHRFAKSKQTAFIECSAKSDINVNDIFDILVKNIHENTVQKPTMAKSFMLHEYNTLLKEDPRVTEERSCCLTG